MNKNQKIVARITKLKLHITVKNTFIFGMYIQNSKRFFPTCVIYGKSYLYYFNCRGKFLSSDYPRKHTYMFPLTPRDNFGPDMKSKKWKYISWSSRYVNGKWVESSITEKLSNFTGRKCLF